jgi:hypothetical protein
LLRALSALVEAGVDFVVVVVGIDFHARTPARVFTTLGLDPLLPLAVANLAAAIRVLFGLGYGFEAGGKPWGRLEKLLRSKQRSGHPKDLEFLRAFEARGADEPGE